MILVLLQYTYTCLILTVLLYYLFLLVCACIKIVFNKLDYVQGHTKIPGGECHRHRKGIRKRDDEVWTLCNIWDFWCGCWQMHRWTMAVLLCMCSVFPTKRLEQTIVMSLYDVMRISCAIVGGNYKRRA